MNELKDELLKVKANEKKLKTELNDEKLKNSKILQDAMKNAIVAPGNMGQPPSLGYQGYLARHRVNNQGSGLITGKIGLQSKFFDLGKINSADDSGKAAANKNRRSSILPNPLAFSSGRPAKRQGLGLSNNIHEMLNVAGMKPDPSILEELEEDCKTDIRAEAIDELDILADDLDNSSDDDKDD